MKNLDVRVLNTNDIELTENIDLYIKIMNEVTSNNSRSILQIKEQHDDTYVSHPLVAVEMPTDLALYMKKIIEADQKEHLRHKRAHQILKKKLLRTKQ